MKKRKFNLNTKLKTKLIATGLTAGLTIGTVRGRFFNPPSAPDLPIKQPETTRIVISHPQTEKEAQDYIQSVTAPLPNLGENAVYQFHEQYVRHRNGDIDRLGVLVYRPYNQEINRFAERLRLDPQIIKQFASVGTPTDPLYGTVIAYALTKNIDTGKFVSNEIKFVVDSALQAVPERANENIVTMNCCNLRQNIYTANKLQTELTDDSQIAFVSDGLTNSTLKDHSHNRFAMIHYFDENNTDVVMPIPGANDLWEKAKDLYLKRKSQAQNQTQNPNEPVRPAFQKTPAPDPVLTRE